MKRPSCDHHPTCGSSCANQRVPSVYITSIRRRSELCQSRFLDCSEGSDFIPTARRSACIPLKKKFCLPRADDANDGRRKKNPIVPKRSEYSSSSSHHNCPKGQDSFPSHPIRKHSQDEAYQSIPDQSQCHKEPNFRLRDVESCEVSYEDERRAAVCKQADESLEAEELDVDG